MMNELNNHYDELCELIYQIPYDQNNWDLFAKKLIQLLGASYVHIHAIDFSLNVLSYTRGIGPLAKEVYATYELDYLRFPIEDDPRWGRFLNPDRIGWYQCLDDVSQKFVDQSDLYQKVLLPLNIRYVATHELIWDEHLCVYWSISTSQARGALNQQELEFLNRLLPHLQKVVKAQRYIYELSSNTLTGYNLIEKLPQPIVLLSLSGEVIHCNRHMQDYLNHQNIVSVVNKHLKFPKADLNNFLKILYKIEDLFRYQKSELQEYKNYIYTIPINSDFNIIFEMDLMISEKEMSYLGVRPLIMLTFKNYTHQAMGNAVYLKQKYKLAKREIEVCQLFLDGNNLDQIGDLMGITQSSIRTYMKSIFYKLGCKSQVELMRLLMQINLQHK